jgi:hypothetical protein
VTALDARHRYPWTEADERFLIAAKRNRFADKMIATFLGRTPASVHVKLNRLREDGVLLCHREEEIDLLEKLLAESQKPDCGEVA